MLSNRELFQHSFFSGLAALAILAGLSAAIRTSHATGVPVSNVMLAEKLAICLVASLVFAGLVYIVQKSGYTISFLLAAICIYLPTLLVLGWAVKIYIRNVITIT